VLTDTTNEARADAGIYLGHPAWGTHSYLLYNYETKAQFERTRVEFNPTSFPLRDLLEAAERLPRDRAVDLQGVRQYGLLRLDEATDSQLGGTLGTRGFASICRRATFRSWLLSASLERCGAWCTAVISNARSRWRCRSCDVRLRTTTFNSRPLSGAAGRCLPSFSRSRSVRPTA